MSNLFELFINLGYWTLGPAGWLGPHCWLPDLSTCMKCMSVVGRGIVSFPNYKATLEIYTPLRVEQCVARLQNHLSSLGWN